MRQKISLDRLIGCNIIKSVMWNGHLSYPGGGGGVALEEGDGGDLGIGEIIEGKCLGEDRV